MRRRRRAPCRARPERRRLRGLGQAEVTGSTWSSRFRVHHRVADRYRNGRLLLAGDAAHVHSPAGGQGMNTGIQDGYALGRAIAAGRLDAYEAQRRPVARRVVAFTHRMTRVATARNAAARAARNIALPLLGPRPVPGHIGPSTSPGTAVSSRVSSTVSNCRSS
ncbi:FAD-dependent monooxygenase [Streptomyces parvulus]|uniref:FAD-dependent monooxygenase n=1 Tax=Streptomyces parvulus TaxID=146923 RepID=UPI0033FC382E